MWSGPASQLCNAKSLKQLHEMLIADSRGGFQMTLEEIQLVEFSVCVCEKKKHANIRFRYLCVCICVRVEFVAAAAAGRIVMLVPLGAFYSCWCWFFLFWKLMEWMVYVKMKVNANFGFQYQLDCLNYIIIFQYNKKKNSFLWFFFISGLAKYLC